ncbi:hypothetical protein LshimejAT787_0406820 [Lyophyllum shimeji]|uniref:Uncharacterized protein n=1 Tax=Lyophyllum shimeji TaxID=47721 RepID=A0A9P3UNU6_LYOSH|nr:hypothetical protein LshimejAT787_0406820 [Lyophyllum shimeji]
MRFYKQRVASTGFEPPERRSSYHWPRISGSTWMGLRTLRLLLSSLAILSSTLLATINLSRRWPRLSKHRVHGRHQCKWDPSGGTADASSPLKHSRLGELREGNLADAHLG